MKEKLDRLETRKDTIQVAVESGATHVSSIVGVLAGAVRDVTREIGDWATDLFEIRDAARRARGESEADESEADSPHAGEPE
ncbi:MAG TPA: hypothetical protein VGX16_00110 [Solirubrobacteraceae bacterium]|jgi:hypothetical protein|nr:hypothetical protein [Solirubrobacteraceae bacterium]